MKRVCFDGIIKPVYFILFIIQFDLIVVMSLYGLFNFYKKKKNMKEKNN